MPRFGDRLRSDGNTVVIGSLTTLELWSGPMPDDPDTYTPTGDRLCIWPGSISWDKSRGEEVRLPEDFRIVMYLRVSADAIPEMSGTVGYARLREVAGIHVPAVIGGGAGDPLEWANNNPGSARSAFLTVGLEGSGADIEFGTLDVQAGIPIRVTQLSSSTIRGAS